MLRLPPPRPSNLEAFWLCLVGGVATLLGLALWIAGVRPSAAAGVALLASALAALAGLSRRGLQARLYAGWDRGAARVGALAERAVSATLRQVVLDAVAKSGTRLGLAEPPLSRGRRHATGYRRWALRARSPWAMALVPGLSILSALGSARRSVRHAARGRNAARKVLP